MTLDPAQIAMLFAVGAVASGINTIAGGGSLVSFPTLTLGLGMDSKIANATNTVALWPGSMSGALGYRELLGKTKRHFKLFVIPTLVGSMLGSIALVRAGKEVFEAVVPFLLFFAAGLLWFQPKIKAIISERTGKLSPFTAALLQILVAFYGGYFGAGMGIMMLAVFTLFMEGTIHEVNAVKNWLGVLINLTASTVFISRGMVDFAVAVPLIVGSIVGGFAAARLSLRVDSERLRVWISIYGILMALYFAVQTWVF